jgi:hypothetical protein
LLFTCAVPLNSGQDAGRDHPDDAANDSTAESNQAETADTDTSSLQRAQDAIDQGWDAAREALKDTLPDDEDTNSSQSEPNTGPEAQENPVPRPT